MKISENTLDVLKNFSTINQSLLFNKGNVIRTVNEQKSVMAKAKVEESFPLEFAIYELNQFLGLSSLFEDADYDFQERQVTLKEGQSKASYTYADKSMITAPKEGEVELPSVDVEFDLSKEDFRAVLNGANQLGLSEVVVRSEDGLINLVATDTKNPTSNEFSRTVGKDDADFQFIFRTENLKMIHCDYKVKISSGGLAEFSGDNIQYWSATESGSKYNS